MTELEALTSIAVSLQAVAAWFFTLNAIMFLILLVAVASTRN